MSMFILPRSRSEWLLFIVKLIIGGFFIYASIDKIINPEGFAKSIHNYRMMPPVVINFMAILMPWLELVTGLSLIIGYRYRGANLLILAMLVVFIVALSYAAARGLNINCGCFSTSSTAKSDLVARIIEDTLMVIGCVIIMLQNKIFRNRYTARLN
jgi:uncharacterized membrane protein YphA (DoxX/SURF4 family)